MLQKIKQICYSLWLHRQDFNYIKRNNCWSIYHFVYKRWWNTSWNSKRKFYFNFFLSTGIIKKILSITRNKKETHDKILLLAKSRLDSIETLVSQALIDMEITHEKFVTTLGEKNKYEKMKENLRNVNEQ